jgi:hypothetical protein
MCRFEQTFCCCRRRGRPGSNLAVRCASCQVLGPILGLVEHLCLPVELRRPTRPPRFLPRYHTTTRSASSSTVHNFHCETRADTELTLNGPPTRRTSSESYSFRRRDADDTRRARVPPSIAVIKIDSLFQIEQTDHHRQRSSNDFQVLRAPVSHDLLTVAIRRS